MKRVLTIVLSMLCLGLCAKAENTDLSQYENVVYAEDLTASAGTTVSLVIKMNNKQSVTGFQFDLTLPEGVTVATDADGFYLAELSLDRTTTKKTDYFNSAMQPSGAVRIMCSSTKSYAFAGSTGKVAIIQLQIGKGVAPGNYPIQLKDEVISYADASGCKVASVEATLTIPGDSPSSEQTDTDISQYADIVYVEPQTLTPNSTIAVPILLKNSMVTSGFTCTLVLPTGLSIVTDDEGYPDVVANAERFDNISHASCYGDYDSDGNVTINCATTNATRYKLVGTAGAVATIKLKVAENLAEGRYPILLKDVEIANADETVIDQVQATFTYGSSWKCTHVQGDVNGDGILSTADLTLLIELLLNQK